VFPKIYIWELETCLLRTVPRPSAKRGWREAGWATNCKYLRFCLAYKSTTYCVYIYIYGMGILQEILRTEMRPMCKDKTSGFLVFVPSRSMPLLCWWLWAGCGCTCGCGGPGHVVTVALAVRLWPFKEK